MLRANLNSPAEGVGPKPPEARPTEVVAAAAAVPVHWPSAGGRHGAHGSLAQYLRHLQQQQLLQHLQVMAKAPRSAHLNPTNAVVPVCPATRLYRRVR
mmetsp:Transcript_27660/g.65017  ORF Transcript_27660/g.65017 Transcript_27660/m.65017 type:complete len:98 (-) Transcript_27660:1454-1747(-)